jgi:LacI family transcriptional regulator
MFCVIVLRFCDAPKTPVKQEEFMSSSKKTPPPSKIASAAFHRRPIRRILLLVETSRTYGRSIAEGIARYALENGPWSIQFEERAVDSSPPKWLEEWRGDGIISRTVSLKLAKMLWATKRPMIELFGGPKICNPHVRTDTLIGGRMVVEHFLKCGLRRFAHFAYEDTWWIESQREDFHKAADEKGCPCYCYQAPAMRRSVPVWHERYRLRLIKWLRSLPRPIGILAAVDLHAARLLDVCRELDIAVPEEVAIVGIGNDPVICETTHPTLSSLDLDGRRVGYEAARLLDQKMAGKKLKDTLYVSPGHVAVRQSTDTLAVEDEDLVQAMRFIREFACTGIDVARVADEVGLSRRVLERRFHEHLGFAPKKEIMRIRIEHAKTLLARTDKTIESILRKSGFHSVAHFTVAFHRETGMTPNAYRQTRRISRGYEEEQREMATRPPDSLAIFRGN